MQFKSDHLIRQVVEIQSRSRIELLWDFFSNARLHFSCPHIVIELSGLVNEFWVPNSTVVATCPPQIELNDVPGLKFHNALPKFVRPWLAHPTLVR